VRPEFFTDVKMSQLSPLARLLYVGLWCYADDEGRGEYLPKLIEGSVFPHCQVDVRALLAELIELGRVRTYEVDGQQYFYIPRFEDYQKPNRKYESKLPKPPVSIEDSADTLPTQRASTADAHAVVGVGVGVGVGEGVGVVAQIPTSARKRDEVWDAMADVFGEPETTTARSLRGKLVKSLKAAGATYDDIVTRVQAWPMHFPDATLTETAFEKHYTTLGRPPLRASEKQVREVTKERERQARLAAAQRLDEERKALEA
jgi:hypothetical protein